MDCSTPGSSVLHYFPFSSIQSDSLRPHGLQHTRLPCPSSAFAPSPEVCSNSCPLSRWWYLMISSSAASFSSCLQSFLSSGSFPMSWLFASGDQSFGTSALATVLPMNIQSWFPLGLTGLISLQFKGLKNLLQHYNLKASVLWWSAFFYAYFIEPVNSWFI